jgi:phenylalanyl-tRNA synthetase beta chain
MKVSVNLLKNILNIDLDNIKEITQDHIYEVEDYKKLIDIKGLKIGHVLECEDIEGTHLHKCLVSFGNEETGIVCGARNVAKGQFVIVATPGVKLGEDFIIKKSKY